MDVAPTATNISQIKLGGIMDLFLFSSSMNWRSICLLPIAYHIGILDLDTEGFSGDGDSYNEKVAIALPT